MNIKNIGKYKNYIKTGIVATAVSIGVCVKKHVNHTPMVKDVVEFAEPTAARLIESLENGNRHSKTIVIFDTGIRTLTKRGISKYKVVPDSIVAKFQAMKDKFPNRLNALPDTIETFFRVYEGNADKAIQQALNKDGKLLTVAHGTTGRDKIRLAGGKEIKEGDYVSGYVADSLFNRSILREDSSLRSNTKRDVYSDLKRYQKDAILSYMYNICDTILKKRNPKRPIPESFFECLNKNMLGKVQSKFNIRPSAKEAECGLMKRNLIQMIIFGNGKIYNDIDAQKTFYNSLSILKKHKSKDRLCSEVIEKASEYGVDEKNLRKTKESINIFISK